MNHGGERRPFKHAARPNSNKRSYIEPIVKAEVALGVRGPYVRAVRMNRGALYGLRGSLRAALAGYRRADCIVYDADGKPIAKINAETRERTMLPAAEVRP